MSSDLLSFADLDLWSDDNRRLREQAMQRLGAGSNRLFTNATAFTLRSAWSPGFICIGGRVHDTEGSSRGTFDVSGRGETLESAFVSFAGEAIERVSCVERPSDTLVQSTVAQARSRTLPQVPAMVAAATAAQPATDDVPLDWLPARRLTPAGCDDTILLPADWCLRRSDARRTLPPLSALSSGTAAGPDFAWCALHAVLELVERDAASLWWIGGRRGRAIGLDGPGMDACARLLARLRGGAQYRRTFLLDIASNLGVPVVAAWSCSPRGDEFACGLAARLDVAAAAEAALLELCQIEIAYQLAAMKASVGRDRVNLTPTDHQHLARARLDVASCAVLFPYGLSLAHPLTAAESALSDLLPHVSKAGIDIALVDHTRPEFGTAVVRACSPTLQQMPSALVSDRLRQVIAETGGGPGQPGGLALM